MVQYITFGAPIVDHDGILYDCASPEEQSDTLVYVPLTPRVNVGPIYSAVQKTMLGILGPGGFVWTPDAAPVTLPHGRLVIAFRRDLPAAAPPPAPVPLTVTINGTATVLNADGTDTIGPFASSVVGDLRQDPNMGIPAGASIAIVAGTVATTYDDVPEANAQTITLHNGDSVLW